MFYRKYKETILQSLLKYGDTIDSSLVLDRSDASKRDTTVALELWVNAIGATESLTKFSVVAVGNDLYAVRLLEAVSVAMDHGALRLSFVHYTKEEEVKAVIQALDEVL